MKYRVGYKKGFGGEVRYKYFDTHSEAKYHLKNLIHSGYIGYVQHWNRREGLWIG